MADRYSEPSTSVGIERFFCWPAGSDSYDHAELTDNWDYLDALIGAPSGGTAWPPTTGLDGGLYFLISLLQLERAPIGTVSYWFRPSTDVPLTTITNYGYVVVDGSTLASDEHSFPGVSGSVTLPNMLNAFPLGADPAKTIGQAADIVSSVNVNNSNGAPGIGGMGGFNGNTLDITMIPAHNHGGGVHTHTLNRQVIQLTTGGLNYLINVRDSVTNTETTNASSAIISTQGGGLPYDNRPCYVGLLPIMKVMYISSLS